MNDIVYNRTKTAVTCNSIGVPTEVEISVPPHRKLRAADAYLAKRGRLRFRSSWPSQVPQDGEMRFLSKPRLRRLLSELESLDVILDARGRALLKWTKGDAFTEDGPELYPMYWCPQCEEVINPKDEDIGPAFYECDNCGSRYDADGSRNGGNICPDCMRFGYKLGDHSCPRCQDSELEECLAYRNQDGTWSIWEDH